MPTTWGYAEVAPTAFTSGSPRVVRAATIACPTCDERITFEADRDSLQSGEERSIDGRTVGEVFRFVSGRGRYTTSCRACERTARKRAMAALTGGERKFGVEIECNLPEDVGWSEVTDALRDAGIDVDYDSSSGERVWSLRGDGSLGSLGVEVVSPPLKGEDGHAQIATVCRVLREHGATVDTRCGLHVHHDIRGARTTVDTVKRFVRTWAANQELVDALVSASRRSGGSDYCKRLNESELERLDRIDRLEDLASITHDRYKAVNVTAYPSHGTIEIRQHQGTIDATKISSWVRLGQAMLDDAEARRTPRQTAGSVQEMLERLGDRINENARTYLLGRAVELGHRGIRVLAEPVGSPAW